MPGCVSRRRSSSSDARRVLMSALVSYNALKRGSKQRQQRVHDDGT